MEIPAFYFGARYLLLLLIPAVLAGIYFFGKAVGRKQKVLVGTRTIICVLLIIALANPVSFLTLTRTDRNPDLILVSDTTASMNYFSKGAGQELYEFFSGRFNVKYDVMSGNYTALGEKVLQYADGRNQIILVSDGNSNYGTELDSAIDAAIQTGSKISAVIPGLVRNDLSAEIIGDKTVIHRNDQEFTLRIQQANSSDNRVAYTYEIAQNGVVIYRGNGVMEDTEKLIPFTTNFSSLGAQTLTATITSPQDSDAINNVFTKSIYVIEKPNVLVVTSEPNASLTQVVGTLYNVTVVSNLAEFGSTANLEKALNASKTVVLDNMYIGNITEEQTECLKRYVSNGGGLVVVGGTSSYGFMSGNGSSYLNTSFEKMLPVVSIPSDWEGMQDVYLFIDVSDSLNTGNAANIITGEIVGDTIQANVKKSAVNIIENDFFKEANMTYFTIGGSSRNDSGEFYFAGNPMERQRLVREIEMLQTGDGSTDLRSTFERATKVMENRTGQPLVIILSDGNILGTSTYNELLRAVNDADKYGATILFMNHYSTKIPGQFNDSRGRIYAQSLMRDYRGAGVYIESVRGLPLYPRFEQIFGSGNNTDENVTKSFLYISNPKHFIVQKLNLTETNISGYNGVTPKAGSDKLVIASDGSPILTVWRYGLGRVASLTTDNGLGRGNSWAPQLYAAPGSKLVTATTNWVMGDPNKESGLVIDCPDTYVGVPVTLRVQMYDGGVPVLMLDGQKLLLTMESKDVYVTELVFNQTGTYNISGYPVTVNYPTEYKDIGVNPDFRKMIESTGGNVYTVAEAKALYIQINGETVTYKTKEAVSFNVYLLLLALVIFLSEVAYRRVREIKELKRLHEEYDRREAESPGSMPRPDMSQFKRQNDMVADAKSDAKKFLAKIKEKSSPSSSHEGDGKQKR